MNIKKILAIIPKRLLLLLTVTLFISSFEGVVNSAVIGYLPNFSQNSSLGRFVRFVAIAILAYTIVYLSIWVLNKVQNKIIYLLNTQLKSEYIEKATFKKIDTNQEISTLINDFKLIETNYFSLLIQIVSDFCMAIFSTVFVLRLNFLLGIVFIAFAIPQIFIPNIFQPILSRRSVEWSDKNSSYVEKLRDLMGGRDTILRYGAFIPAFKKIKQQLFSTENSYKNMNNSRIDTQLASWLWSLVALFVPLSLAFYLMITKKNVTPSIILSIYLANGQVMQPLKELINDFATMKTTRTLRKSIGKMLSNQTNLAEEDQKAAPVHIEALEKISAKNISFSFGDKKILENVSFTINENDKILLTGASGMGKSTIFSLIMGAMQPKEGQINYFVKGKSNNQFDAKDFALIQQSPYIFNDTIRYNLGLGLDFSDKWILDCLKKVGLDSELGDEPLNYVCRNGGSNLSGGQCERLEIARALVFDRQVILADEIDANLDPQNAYQIEGLLANINKIVIMISHHMNAQQAQKFGFRQWTLNYGKLTEVPFDSPSIE